VKTSQPEEFTTPHERAVCKPVAEEYDGQAGEIWSLGCILFMMLTGAYAVSKPHPSDARYVELGVGSLLNVDFAANMVPPAALGMYICINIVVTCILFDDVL